MGNLASRGNGDAMGMHIVMMAVMKSKPVVSPSQFHTATIILSISSVRKRHVDCTFNDTYLCGYHVQYPGWQKVKIAESNSIDLLRSSIIATHLPAGHLMLFQGPFNLNGDSSLLTSPMAEYLVPRTLTFNLNILKNQGTITKLDILVITESRPSGTTLATFDDPLNDIVSVCVPSGKHSVVFKGTVAQGSKSSISMGKVSLGEECLFYESKSTPPLQAFT